VRGARASELLGTMCGYLDPGQQLITVIRKGSRALRQLPVSPDAFVWLRLYQAQMQDLVPFGRDQPVWRPFRQLTYHAAYRMFTRWSVQSVTGIDMIRREKLLSAVSAHLLDDFLFPQYVVVARPS
jgi:site-specific recombinase XerC